MTLSLTHIMDPACPVMMKMIILVLWLSSGPVQTFNIQQSLWYIPYPRTWMDARANCKSEYNGDLAIETMNEVSQMSMNSFYAWIGLRKYGSMWSWDNGIGAFQTVQTIFSTPNGNKECGKALFKTQRPLDDDCKNLHFFYCRDKLTTSSFIDIFVPKAKTWEGAKAYCVEQSYEFIAITGDNDLHWGSSPFYVDRNFPVWIGQYQNGECGVIWSQNKSSSYQNCSEAFPYMCSANNLRLVQDLLTWEQSYNHCKSHAPDNYASFQLFSGDTQDLQFIQFIASNATTDKVWLGLRFIGGTWFWSDGRVLPLPNLPSCPELTLRCGALVVNRQSSTSEPTIIATDCSEKLNLICYGL